MSLGITVSASESEASKGRISLARGDACEALLTGLWCNDSEVLSPRLFLVPFRAPRLLGTSRDVLISQLFGDPASPPVDFGSCVI